LIFKFRNFLFGNFGRDLEINKAFQKIIILAILVYGIDVIITNKFLD
jgi:hypothetical protein